MSDSTAQGAPSGVPTTTQAGIPFYKSTKKTLGVIGAFVLYLVFVLMAYGWIKNGMTDASELIDMAQVIALYSAACLGIKTFGGVLTGRASSGGSQ